MKYFKLEKNLVITYVIHLSLQLQIHSVYNGRELVWKPNWKSLNGSLVTPLQTLQNVYIISWFPIEFNFEKDKSFRTA